MNLSCLFSTLLRCNHNTYSNRGTLFMCASMFLISRYFQTAFVGFGQFIIEEKNIKHGYAIIGNFIFPGHNLFC